MLCNAFYYFIIYYFIIAQLLLPLDAIFNCSEYTVSQKKHAILVLGIILANVDRFSFTVGLSNKFAARPTTP